MRGTFSGQKPKNSLFFLLQPHHPAYDQPHTPPNDPHSLTLSLITIPESLHGIINIYYRVYMLSLRVRRHGGSNHKILSAFLVEMTTSVESIIIHGRHRVIKIPTDIGMDNMNNVPLKHLISIWYSTCNLFMQILRKMYSQLDRQS
jgi:hypothetical protein